MNDPASAARTARESLARGLSVLQSPGVPPHVMDVAEPVAQAMGALHRIESTQGGALPEQAPLALDAVRRALGMLQAAAGQHPAVDQATEAVAGSLGVIHSLSQMAAAPPPAPAAAPPVAAAPPQPAPAFQQAPPAAAPPFNPGFPPAQSPFPQSPGNPYPAAPQAAPAPYMPPPTSPAAPGAMAAAMGGTMVMPPTGSNYGPPPTPAPFPAQPYPMQGHPYPQGQPPAAYPAQPPPPGYGVQAPGQSAPSWGAAPAQPSPGSWPQNPAPAAAAVPASAPIAAGAGATVPTVQAPPGAPRVDADLGAHSPTNFYKGLSGNDVIDSGGIFVATYKIPKLGTSVVIHVSLPGGYEFEALGVVEWVREAPNSTQGIEAPPGFGAKFTQITAEGRQLVYRYVRNREPLFHDDL